MIVRDLVACSLLPHGRRRTAALGTVLALDPAGQPLPVAGTLEQVLQHAVAAGGDRQTVLADIRRDADAAIARAATAGFHLIGWLDVRYPAALRAIPDPPPVLWLRGDPACLAMPSVAIVGSRAASPYGLSVARQLGHDLARAGVTIVSGLARGCDGAAHQGALDAAGRTVAVVGCGVDIVYPREHHALAAAVATRGVIASELAPGTPPLPAHFPLRNRIIAGLSAAVVVIEASSRSGSLITASCALEQGREVMAVPGNVLSERHTGCHELVRDGACLVQSAGDVLEALGWLERPTRQRRGPSAPSREEPGGSADTANDGPLPTSAAPELRTAALASESGDLLAYLPPGEALDLDALVGRAGRRTEDLLAELTRLELAGSIRRLSGGRFMRSGRWW